MEDFETCPCCGSNACIKTPASDGTIIQQCWTCGMTTNSLMKNEGDFEKQNYDQTAAIIKDLKQVHEDLAWYPKIINLPQKGMIFPEWNKRVKDWYWAAVKAIPIIPEEQDKYPDPNNPGEFYKFKMDIQNIKRYDKMCFMDAAEEIGLFDAK